ncbi:MAG: hypothetical protein KGV57_01500 [Fusobacterium sp.]|nr:hypothetical protein [Fusobacterium sp.]
MAGEKNNLDELLKLQEELDKVEENILEKLTEWEEAEKELNLLNNLT